MQKDSLKNILNVAVDDDYNPGDYLILHLQFSFFFWQLEIIVIDIF
jgi:hypothetical protein